jgi:hypothetical protein
MCFGEFGTSAFAVGSLAFTYSVAACLPMFALGKNWTALLSGRF